MAKKAKKKTTKKTAKKTAKKTTKKAAKKSGKKAAKKSSSRRSSSSSSFPTMDTSSRSDDLYTPPPADSYSMPSTTMDSGDEGSSRRVAILGIVILVAVVIVLVAGKDRFFGKAPAGTKTEMGVDSGKKETAMKMEPMAKKEEPKAADKAPKGAARTYVVKKGDSLAAISRKMLGNAARWPEIVKLNGLKSARDAKVGQTLKIPAK